MVGYVIATVGLQTMLKLITKEGETYAQEPKKKITIFQIHDYVTIDGVIDDGPLLPFIAPCICQPGDAIEVTMDKKVKTKKVKTT